MRRFALGGSLFGLAILCLAAMVLLNACEFIPSSEGTVFGDAIGDAIGDAEREAFTATSGLDLPASAVFHAYHAESSLDQSVLALVTLPQSVADSLLAAPPFDAAVWRDAPDVPTLEAALATFPAWPTTGASGSGRRTTLDLAPGRRLTLYAGDDTPDTATLSIQWFTY